MSNYAQLNIVNDLSRVSGVSQVRIFGQRQYAMRIWLDPIALAQQGLDAGDVVTALQEQNVEVASRQHRLGTGVARPAVHLHRQRADAAVDRRKSSPTSFCARTPTAVSRAWATSARVELGAEDYSSSLRFDGNASVVGMGVLQYPTANALQVSKGALAEMNAACEVSSRPASTTRSRSTRPTSCASRSKKS